MSSGEGRKVSCREIQIVQNLIERCLQLYMSQKEVVHFLLTGAKVEPGFTELVWQKLEEENKEFFKAYHVRLMLKKQITVFNKLLEKQVELTHKGCPSGVASVPLSNGSNNSTLHQVPSCYLSERPSIPQPDNMLSNGGSTSSFINGGPLGHQRNQLGTDTAIIGGHMDDSMCMMSTHSSHMERLQAMNAPALKSELSYPSNSSFGFFSDSSYLDVCSSLGDAAGAPFGNLELTDAQLNEPLLDNNTPIGFLSRLPRNVSLSDLTDDFSQGADIFENYKRSPFIETQENNTMDSPEEEYKDDENRRLDTISEGISYEEFGSD